MKIKNIFFILFITHTFNIQIFASEQYNTEESTSEQATNLEQKQTETSQSQSDSQEIQATTQPDFVDTKIDATNSSQNQSWLDQIAILERFRNSWYGAAALAGKTRYAIFMELGAKGYLKAYLLTNPKIAGDRLRDGAQERLSERVLTKASNQEKIFKMLKLAKQLEDETQQPFQLDKGLANKYKISQECALLQIVSEQAKQIQPKLQNDREMNISQLTQERDKALEKINKEYTEACSKVNATYEAEMIEQLTFAAQTASNSRTLFQQAQDPRDFPLHDQNNFENLENFTQFLTSVREDKEHKYFNMVTHLNSK